jgi:ABC-type uncharacterized transport system substrate-binding protein
MRRREFIVLLGGAALACPFDVGAQESRPVIGFLHPVSADEIAHFVAPFRRGLSEAGYVEGQNVTIEFRWAEGRVDRLSELAVDLVRRRVGVIATPGNMGATLAAKAATTTIPIVFAVPEDPVKFGLVASLARPGGNATGINYFTTEVLGKRLSLLHELVAKTIRVAVLVNPADATNTETTVKEVTAAARVLGLQFETFNATTSEEIDLAFAAFVRARCGALFVAPGAFFNARRVQLANLPHGMRFPLHTRHASMSKPAGL